MIVIQTIQIRGVQVDLAFEEAYIEAMKKVSLKSTSTGKKRSCFCQDCDYPYPEMFMVIDEVWLSAGCSKDDFLCINCFTEKLGRKLTIYDLKQDVPLNNNILQILANFDI